jgi:hypothetical protein
VQNLEVRSFPQQRLVTLAPKARDLRFLNDSRGIATV